MTDPDMPTGLQFVEEPGPPDTANIMLYGPPKSGKSTAAATAPGPILWLSAEGPGALAYARKMARQRDTRIMEVRLETSPDPVQTLRDVVQFIREQTGATAPKSVVVDTVAKVREALISQLVEPNSKNSLKQYGEVAKVLRGFVRVLRDEPVNLILIAHQDVSDSDGERLVRPLVGGALTEELPGEVDIVAYTHSYEHDGARKYVGQLVEAKGRIAGDRSGGLGAVRDLDVTDWLAAYRDALGAGDIPWEATGDDPDADASSTPSDPESLLDGVKDAA